MTEREETIERLKRDLKLIKKKREDIIRKDTIERIERVLELTHKNSITVTIPRLTAERVFSMLKEQEAVPVDNGKCPSCNWDFEDGELDFSNINESRFYCPRCGQAVKWND